MNIVDTMNNINYKNIINFFIVIVMWWAVWNLLSYLTKIIVTKTKINNIPIYIGSIITGLIILITTNYKDFIDLIKI